MFIKILFVFLLIPIYVFAQPFSATDINKCKQQARNVTIIRDNYGIPHIYGKTDADAVFGFDRCVHMRVHTDDGQDRRIHQEGEQKHAASGRSGIGGPCQNGVSVHRARVLLIPLVHSADAGCAF